MAKSIATTAAIKMIDPAELSFLAKYNVRDKFDPANDPEDASLLSSLRKMKYDPRSPIMVAQAPNTGKLYVIRGHRRVSAVWLLNKEEPGMFRRIPAMMAPVDMTEQDIQADLILSNSGKPLSLAEIGTVCERMLAAGYDKAEMAERFGYTARHIDNAIAQAKLDPRLNALVRAGKVKPTLGRKLAQAHGDERAIDIVTAVNEETGQAATSGNIAETEAKLTGASPVADAINRNQPGGARRNAPPVAPPAPPRESRNGTTNAAGYDVARLEGPFRVGPGDGSLEIQDGKNAGIASADSPAMARAIVDFMNRARSAPHNVPEMVKPGLRSVPASGSQRAAAASTPTVPSVSGK